jgi:hypothetical protein
MRQLLVAALMLCIGGGELAAQENDSATASEIAGTVIWLRRPNDVPRGPWPTRTDAPLPALVVLDCLVGEDGRLSCQISSEDPPGFGYGALALRISRGFQMAPLTVEGEPTVGRTYRLRIPFEAGE